MDDLKLDLIPILDLAEEAIHRRGSLQCILSEVSASSSTVHGSKRGALERRPDLPIYFPLVLGSMRPG